MEKHRSDVVVVGGGLSGIICTYELLNAGKKVLLIDRDKSENLGGLARWAFGGMLFVDTPHQRRMGIRDSVDIARQDWFSFAEFDDDEYWGKKWAEQYLHLCRDQGYRYLRDHGISFFPILNFPERGLYVHGNSLPRFHMVWGTGQALTEVFTKLIYNHPAKQNLELKFRYRATEILVGHNRIEGIRGVDESAKKDFEIRSDQVVIATGGINGSLEKVRENWPKSWGSPPEVILNGAHEYAIGDLHDAAKKINANVVNLDKQWNYAMGIRHYAPRKKEHGLSLVPMKSTLWCNYEGQRIGPMPLVTPYDTRFLVERICREPLQYSWQILNAKIASREFSISGSEHNVAMREKKLLRFLYGMFIKGSGDLMQKIADTCEEVIVASSLDQLVSKMNDLAGGNHVKKKYILEAATKYDAEIRRGSRYFQDEQLIRIAQVRKYIGDRVRTCRFQQILDPRALPLIAIRGHILSRKSMGGIQTNLQSQVLAQPDENGEQKPIEGLYAIGECAGFGGGGMHGHRSLEGTFLGGCVINARVAAAHIAGKPLD